MYLHFNYFDRIEHTEITESISKTIIMLISGIGGSLGLFIGFKFSSFIELIEILIEIFHFYYKKPRISNL